MTTNTRNSFIPILGISSIIALLILSIIYYQERIYFSDPAYQLFLMINDQSIEVMTNRWPSTIFRFLPFIGMKLGASIKTLALLFSVSFPLFHLIAFLISLFVFKDRLISMMIVFSTLLATSETFYWCSSDLLQGIITSFLALAIYRNSDKKTSKILISGLLIIAAVFFHPLVLFPFFFLAIDDFLQFRKIHWSNMFLPLVFGATWLIRNNFFTTWYDQAKSKEFWENVSGRNWLELDAHSIFWFEIPIFYQLVIFILVIDLFIFIKNREWLRIAFLILSCIVFLMVIHLGNPTGMRHFYRESNYVCLAVFVSYPFLKHILKEQTIKSKYQIVIPLMLLFSLFRMWFFSFDYTARIDWLNDRLAAAQCDKSVIEKNNRLKGTLKMEWAIPFETALISAERKEYKTIFYTKNVKDYLKKENDEAFLSPFVLLKTSDFNPAYFQFSKGQYCRNSIR